LNTEEVMPFVMISLNCDVHPGAVRETLKDLVSLVAIERFIGEELMLEDPFARDDVGAMGPGDKLTCPIAHQGLVLLLHSRAPIQISMCSSNRGRNHQRCHRGSHRSKGEPI
jgi:hypothetical protein